MSRMSLNPNPMISLGTIITGEIWKGTANGYVLNVKDALSTKKEKGMTSLVGIWMARFRRIREVIDDWTT